MGRPVSTITLNDFLIDTFSDECLGKADAEYILTQIPEQLRKIKKGRGLSVRAIAERMGYTSHSTVQRMLSGKGAHNMTLSTLIRFAYACDCKVTLVFQSLFVEVKG